MRNIVNIDLSNNSCWGTTNEAENVNVIDLNIKLPDDIDKSNIKLEFTKVDVSIITTSVLPVENNIVSYEMPFNLYQTQGTIKLRIFGTGYSSDYIMFTVNEDMEETDDICALYNSLKSYFSINKCYHVEEGETTVHVGTTRTGEPGTDALVTNSGTATDVVLNFVIPRGEKGEQGEPGTPGKDGADGTLITINGIFTMTVDEDGNLFVNHYDEDYPPEFEYNEETGDLYLLMPEE